MFDSNACVEMKAIEERRGLPSILIFYDSTEEIELGFSLMQKIKRGLVIDLVNKCNSWKTQRKLSLGFGNIKGERVLPLVTCRIWRLLHPIWPSGASDVEGELSPLLVPRKQ